MKKKKSEMYRNEIKSYIVRAGMTMSEVVDYLADDGDKGAIIHLVVASSISFVSPQAAKLIHSAAPPIPTKFCNFAGTP